jgi:hypothetical protein
MAYTILILVLTLIATTRKHTGVWKSSVADAPFFTAGASTAQPTSAQAGSYGQSGGYTTQPVTHQTTGGTGPASVQAGTVHHSV